MDMISLNRKYGNTFGKDMIGCRFCGHNKIIRKYNLAICRRCFREFGESIGWNKLN